MSWPVICKGLSHSTSILSSFGMGEKDTRSQTSNGRPFQPIKMELRSPTTETMVIGKKSLTEAWTCIGKEGHDMSGWVLANQSHCIVKAHAKDLRSWIPCPPSSLRWQTLRHVIKQCPPFASFLPLQKKPQWISAEVIVLLKFLSLPSPIYYVKWVNICCKLKCF